jgi:hypothetical protein
VAVYILSDAVFNVCHGHSLVITRVSDGEVGDIWDWVGFPAGFRSREASWVGLWILDRRAAFARRRARAAGSRTGPRGQTRLARTSHNQWTGRRKLSLLVVWPQDNIAQATDFTTFLGASMVASSAHSPSRCASFARLLPLHRAQVTVRRLAHMLYMLSDAYQLRTNLRATMWEVGVGLMLRFAYLRLEWERCYCEPGNCCIYEISDLSTRYCHAVAPLNAPTRNAGEDDWLRFKYQVRRQWMSKFTTAVANGLPLTPTKFARAPAFS